MVLPAIGLAHRLFSIEQLACQWVLTDLTGEGVCLGGKRADREALKHGATLTLGELRAVFILPPRRRDNTIPDGSFDRIPPINHDPCALLVRPPQGEPRRIRFKGKASLGSGDQVTLRVDGDDALSRSHLELTRRGDEFFLEDRSSTNGTYAGQVRLFSAAIPFDLPIRAGRTEVMFQESVPKVPRALEGLLGRSPAMQQIFATIQRVARSTLPVYIHGESGTGKEVAARALHQCSDRARGLFLPLNCAAPTVHPERSGARGAGGVLEV